MKILNKDLLIQILICKMINFLKKSSQKAIIINYYLKKEKTKNTINTNILLKGEKIEYIDLTHILTNNLNVYPGDPEFKINNFKIASKEDPTHISEISSGLHNGTHIDAPMHYIENGEKVKSLKLENLIGSATIIKCEEKEISAQKLENPLEKIIILKTSWCDNWDEDTYFTNNPYLSKDFANTLVEKNIKGIAIDTPSVDKYGENKIHKILLKNNIWIVENLTNTDKLIKNSYNAFFIPMRINAEASFVRAYVKK